VAQWSSAQSKILWKVNRAERLNMSDRQDYIEQLEADALPEVSVTKEKYSDAYFHRNSVIYFIAAGDNPVKAVKIGVTARDSISRRLRSIQSANHERVRLLKVVEFIDGDKPGLRAERKEAELHKQFIDLARAKPFTVGAEWFDWAEPLITFIDEIAPLPDDLAVSPVAAT
jgi:hypothetical protein